MSVKRLLIVKLVGRKNSKMRWLRIKGDCMFPLGNLEKKLRKLKKYYEAVIKFPDRQI